MERRTRSGRHAVLALGREAAAVPTARQFVLQELAIAAVEARTCCDAALAATELVTNALQHAAPPLTLEIEVTADLVRIVVADSGGDLPRLRQPTSQTESGRGLTLLDALASSWGSSPAVSGKRVWCDIPRS